MNWQPIETAPKSEFARQILTFRLYRGGEDSYPANIERRVGPWYQTSFWSAQQKLWVGWPLNVQPTHWMPVPPPPAA